MADKCYCSFLLLLSALSIIYVTGLCFESAYIVKPFRSRIVNSERYVVGKRLRKRTEMRDKLIAHLTNLHASWSDDEHDGTHADSLVPLEVMKGDEKFCESMSRQVQELCRKQTMALSQVMDLADEMRKREKKL